ncbi:MAG TPA: hypothetical protein VIL16_16530 [Trebonia sp.]
MTTVTIVPSMATIMTPSAAESSVRRGLPRIPGRLVVFAVASAPMATSPGWLAAELPRVLGVN